MPTARLNVDVLAIIAEFLTDVEDVLSFSLTCSFLLPAATRKLLSIHPGIRLTGYRSVQRFHTYLFKKVASRAPHIRALDILRQRPLEAGRIASQASIDVTSLLVEIIASCPRLTNVSISFDGDSIDDRPIVAAIAALQTLRSLTVKYWSANALRLLQELSSPIRKLSILSVHCRLDPAALEQFLPRLAHSLDELEFLYFCPRQMAADDMPGSPGFFRNRAQYPAVRSLSVGRLVGPPPLARLQHLFPALDGTLAVGIAQGTMHTYAQAYEDAHAANRRAQDEPPSRAWKKLDRLVCPASVLYILALRCPIHHIMLDLDLDEPGVEEPLRYAAQALRENPAPRLKLTLKYRRGMFDGLFTAELAAPLSHLTLCVVYSNGNGDRPRTEDDAADVRQLLWSDLLSIVVSSLKPLLNVTHLRVVVHINVFKRARAESAEARSHPYSERFVDAVRAPAFDFDAAAAALARALPSAQYVFLTTCGHFVCCEQYVWGPWHSYEQWDASRAWRVADAPDQPEPGMGGVMTDGGVELDGNPVSTGLATGRKLVELHSDVADTIIRNEELVLSEADEHFLDR